MLEEVSQRLEARCLRSAGREGGWGRGVTHFLSSWTVAFPRCESKYRVAGELRAMRGEWAIAFEFDQERVKDGHRRERVFLSSSDERAGA